MLTIVVIEEDIAMRTLFSEWLMDEGYDVKGSCDHRGSHHGGADLVVIDLIDLLNQGAATVQQVKQLYPGSTLIGTSTQLNGPLAANSALARALGVTRLVPKPCTKHELLEAVVSAVGLPS